VTIARISKRPSPLTLIVGILLVIVAFGGVTLLAGHGGGSAPASTIVVGAARDIKTATVISADDLAMIKVDTVPTGTIKSKDAVIGKSARSDIKASTPVVDSMLAAPATAGAPKLYFALPAGTVAINIPATEISPYVQPGDRIDIVASPRQVGGTGTTKTKLAVSALLVLAVGFPGTPNAGNLVVEVTPHEAEVLQFLIKNTDFAYVLRSPSGGSTPEPATNGVDLPTFKQDFGY
jgi:Flp pilus assembly protein CpaB